MEDFLLFLYFLLIFIPIEKNSLLKNSCRQLEASEWLGMLR